jgi:hypothetical protein
MAHSIDSELIDALESYLSTMHEHQLKKTQRIAREHNPKLTDEDLLNPDNFKYLINDARYTYEDGTAAGIMAAKIAIRSFLLELARNK